ncbi:hypothetical protein [Brachybacterium hainanense]|uniref:Beta-carotene 15,15'-monooxygenase n=1 Tax=Brachybacterium hainanense TaxID=1541174 RepID=A0ABV6R6L4_9MICO
MQSRPAPATASPAAPAPSAPTARDVHERGIWRAAFVVHGLGVIGLALTAGGLLVLVPAILLQGTLLGLLALPAAAWWSGLLLIGALHALHGQDLTTDIRPLRRLGGGLRQGAGQAAVLWLPVGVVAAMLLGAQMLRGTGPGPVLPGLVLLLALVLLALIGSVIASRFTVTGVPLWRAALGAAAVSMRGTVGIVLVLAAGLCLTLVSGEWVLLLAAAPLVLLLDRSARPLVLALEASLDDR